MVTRSAPSCRWLPKHGRPGNSCERLAQWLIRTLANLAVYTAVIVTLTLILVVLTR